ncbi:MAG TPA: VCBS repeat-containing protein [Candidatus Paceibacterota bacterium]|nr:VCBS repeat-containing protein [Verrucomicrobiota bacterium]HRY47497.1 VCBS repeat-containing protein [Candidatus Paceibacterota bacterium]HSA00611.1 VCBS repeat-containing protein [Candidatus Paceibacterota bacterium]
MTLGIVPFFVGVCVGRGGDIPENPKVLGTALAVPEKGQTGFSLLSPQVTGLAFTNLLEEEASAANRVLENGSGVAAGDYDNDGWSDLFLCSLSGGSALFRNQGNWRFQNTTREAGLGDMPRVCRGAVFADVNGDRHLDLLVSTLDQGVFSYLNTGQGSFLDATALSGTGGKPGSTTLALADVDGNGTLDLYVTRYRAEDIRDQARVEIQMVNGRMALPPKYQGRLILTPQGLMELGEPDVLYLNEGQGRFREASWTTGVFLDDSGRVLAVPPKDWGLTAAFRDVTGDGHPDLYVCNDYWTPDRFWINDGSGHFRSADRAVLRHTSENSMGIDFGDINRDGHMDFLVLDMLSRDSSLRRRQVLAQTPMPVTPGEILNRPQIMRNVLFLNRGDNSFAEIADYAGLPASDWSWQPMFIDIDLDGWEDLLIPAGHRRDVQDMDATLTVKGLQRSWSKTLDSQLVQQAFTRQMLEHARLYPTLDMPIIAFRNGGNLRFTEMTDLWGTAHAAVHQGIALADFDRDGDLDFVVNNLNSRAGLYRNETSAPRLAVRLLGNSPNTQAIGARVTLSGAAIDHQSQEVVSGGRYLSGSDPLIVFGVGTLNQPMWIDIRWRDGRTQRVSQVLANRLYEIQEPGRSLAAPPLAAAAPIVSPWFVDISDRLAHQHHEDPFDDFMWQPLLPRRLSQMGPGVAWFDVNGDGHEDVIVGGGRGGRLGVFENTGLGQFQAKTNAPFFQVAACDQVSLVGLRDERGRRLVLAGMACGEVNAELKSAVWQYDPQQSTAEGLIPGNGSMTGPLILADIEADGDLDLFVGGRMIPGRYPEAASSRLYRRHNGSWVEDLKNNPLLNAVGLVSGAVFSDLNGDGYPELILACEWGTLRLFENQAGVFQEATDRWGLGPHTGWWTSVNAGDFNNDGRLDLVAGNWGENSPYHASMERPLRLYYGDFMGRGVVDLVETEYDPSRGAFMPCHRLHHLAAGFPLLKERFHSSRSFSEASMDEVLGDLKSRAAFKEARVLTSMLFLNRGGRFEAMVLPPEAQFAPVFSVNIGDVNGDGCEDVFLSQNFFAQRPEMHRLDAGRGLWLRGDGTGKLHAVSGRVSGVKVYGEQRGAALADFDGDGRMDLIVTQNAAATRLFHNQIGPAGLRVRLEGPPGNPDGVGAVLQVGADRGWGYAREIHGGSGFGSQDSTLQIMSLDMAPTRLRVRWPGGKTTESSLPAGVREVRVDINGVLTATR